MIPMNFEGLSSRARECRWSRPPGTTGSSTAGSAPHEDRAGRLERGTELTRELAGGHEKPLRHLRGVRLRDRVAGADDRDRRHDPLALEHRSRDRADPRLDVRGHGDLLTPHALKVGAERRLLLERATQTRHLALGEVRAEHAALTRAERR